MNERSSGLESARRKPWARRTAIASLALVPFLAACGSSDNIEAKPQPSVAAPRATPEAGPQAEKYIAHKDITATVYWIGEGETADSGYIANKESAWSSNAVQDFGGVDSPEGRNFTPEHNPFYIALPAAEFDENGVQPGAYESSPWKDEVSTTESGESLFKGRWVKIMSKDTGVTVYAQWQDIGPCASEQPECVTDYGYVFGTQKPINTFGQKAGIDVSPSVAAALGDMMDGSATVTWEFTDKVPNGPWTEFPALDNRTHWE